MHKEEEIIGRLLSGEPVKNSPTNFTHSSITNILPEVLGKIYIQKKYGTIVEEVEMGRIIGDSICVETTDDDDIIYAQRVGRKGLTRFVKGRNPVPCSKAVVILNWDGRESSYILVTGFVGAKTPVEPWDKKATADSTTFWNSHALILDGSYKITEGSETTICPW